MPFFPNFLKKGYLTDFQAITHQTKIYPEVDYMDWKKYIENHTSGRVQFYSKIIGGKNVFC